MLLATHANVSRAHGGHDKTILVLKREKGWHGFSRSTRSSTRAVSTAIKHEVHRMHIAKLKPHVIESKNSSAIHCKLIRNSATRKRFLEKNELQHLGGHVALASFPSSGSFIARTLIEKSTGVWTGSDVKEYDRKKLAGEGTHHDAVWFVQTHWPDRPAPSFSARRAVVLVRNPLHVLVTWFNTMATGAQNQTLPKFVYKRWRNVWESFVKHELQVWKGFHDYWLKHRSSEIPVLVVRLEDLLGSRREQVVDEIVAFAGANACGLKGSHAACLSSLPGREEEQLGKELILPQLFSPKLLEWVRNETRTWACLLGYGREILGEGWEKVCRAAEKKSFNMAGSNEGEHVRGCRGLGTGAESSGGFMTINRPQHFCLREYLCHHRKIGNMRMLEQTPHVDGPNLKRILRMKGFRMNELRAG
ncbi:hypothetical protein GUITHDRAFT_110947 [Guillardia theta CCMP2712]|uniref:Sulfotransferase domain-containing protein n=1 Tax=Guillardia theta (strain CCMP2712) TaxID=905079 RepID=L1J4G4_GUITC|nr:hypothetical protein GUITHDRAFT_110947 [Guillardia theta CCMP2712]EKX43217.1 hypothetical protein GUITHDRAFT_110947 [Guillardia theta CCMP2712]|eukprot:XP_005830197.1 hypothetical protein GUITHDRAFT_110947 [Guillardia theta CCMP2712]